MTAHFGKLQGDTLELKDGLNILQAPNETGKSTWCAFLLAMLYGINSRERDRAGFIAEKNRYAPWSGTPMSGRLDCEADGEGLTLTRTTRRPTAPFGEFQAVYTGTGNAVPNLTGQTCGETLLGVSREVFERSAFIRQSGLSITQDAGLERRITSLITSGEEGISYSEVMDTLKKQSNSRRHNKTGQIPTLEAELHSIQQRLSELEELEVQCNMASNQTKELSSLEETLTNELAEYERWEKWEKQTSLSETEELVTLAEEHVMSLRSQLEAERIPENDVIARLRGALVNLNTTRKSVEKARAERDEAAKALLQIESAVNEHRFAGQSAEDIQRMMEESSHPVSWNIVPFFLSLLIGVLAAGGVFWAMWTSMQFSALSFTPSLILLFISVVVALRFKKQAMETAKKNALLKRFGTTIPSEIAELTDTYLKLLDVRDAAQAELDKRSGTADTLYNTVSSNEQALLLEVRRFAPSAFDPASADAQLQNCARRRKELIEAEAMSRDARTRHFALLQQLGPLEFENGAPPDEPARSREEILNELEEVRACLTAARSDLDRLSGKLQAMGDAATLREEAEQLTEKLSHLQAEYDALQLAMETLETANNSLQNRFAPALGQKTVEIFQELSGAHYDSVILDRSFHLSAEPSGDSIYRDTQLLSTGTSDQLYLAARLAICEMVLPEEHAVPIILDDALSNFDDERCIATLRWLKKLSKHRQVILFTCHNREANFFANDPKVFVQRLTSKV